MIVQLTVHPAHADVYVSTDGRVFHELRAFDAKTGGYMNVCIPVAKGRGRVRRRSHVVAEAFHGPRPPGMEVCHGNGIPGDDHPKNVSWGTHKKNGEDMVAHGRSLRGEKNPHAKLSQDQAVEVKRRLAAGESGSALAVEFGVTPQLCCDIKKERAWAWL